jgi:hypothetical protein
VARAGANSIVDYLPLERDIKNVIRCSISCCTMCQVSGWPREAANLSGLFTLPFNEGYGAAEYRRVISRQVNALPTFHTDDRLRLRDTQ